MNPEQAFDYICSLVPNDVNFHVKVQYLKIRTPEELVRLAKNNVISPQKIGVVKDCVNAMFDVQIKKHTNVKD